MKTFLRTTLFRFVVGIAFAIAAGFGNLVPKGFIVDDYYYLVKLLPNQAKAEIADKAISDYQHTEIQTQNPTETPSDPARIIETDGITNATTLPAGLPQEFMQPDNSELLIGQANLREQINEQFAKLFVQLQNLTSFCQGTSDTQAPVVDENAQKKAELQAQIEQLQAEMSGL